MTVVFIDLPSLRIRRLQVQVLPDAPTFVEVGEDVTSLSLIAAVQPGLKK